MFGDLCCRLQAQRCAGLNKYFRMNESKMIELWRRTFLKFPWDEGGLATSFSFLAKSHSQLSLSLLERSLLFTT